MCDNLSNGSFSSEQKEVQKITANVDMYSDLMKQVFSKSKYASYWIRFYFQVPLMIFALFLGPWSDTAGRKLLIAFPFFGNCLTCLGFILNVYFFDKLYVEFLWIGEVIIKTVSLHCHHLFPGGWGNVWLLGDLFPWGVRLCG